MPFLAKPAWPVVSNISGICFSLLLSGWLYLISNLGFLDLLVTDDDEVIFNWELLMIVVAIPLRLWAVDWLDVDTSLIGEKDCCVDNVEISLLDCFLAR
ncbi:hypothetical protein Hanom_Chr00s007071g01736461 [Helianthus anomalus]